VSVMREGALSEYAERFLENSELPHKFVDSARRESRIIEFRNTNEINHQE